MRKDLKLGTLISAMLIACGSGTGEVVAGGPSGDGGPSGVGGPSGDGSLLGDGGRPAADAGDAAVGDTGDAGPSLPSITLTELKAFPTAHGYGRHSTGGRGGVVLKVTNLNASGPGSFREAYVNGRGPRTIVFTVAGTINYGAMMFAKNNKVTIAGQTAPGDGVALWSDVAGHSAEMSDATWRHVRFRGTAGDRSNIRIYAGSADVTNVILDHCSFSWADVDEMNIDMGGINGFLTSGVTIQYSINTNSTRGMLMYKGSYNVSVLRSLFAQNQMRGLRADWPQDIPEAVNWFEQSNTIVHAYASVPMTISFGGKFTALNNLQTGSNQVSRSSRMEMVTGESAGEGTRANTQAYVAGNLNEINPSLEHTNLTPYLKTAAYEQTDYVGANLLAADTLEVRLPKYLGARWYGGRDTQDTLMLANFAGRTGAVSFQGTPPVLAAGTAPADTDNDGMSDDFEDLHGLDKNSAADGNATQASWTFAGEFNLVNTAGYTNLEIYLAYLARDFQMMTDGMEMPDGSFTIAR